MIGLSLSFCIRDLIQGNVKDEDVEYIDAATACRTEADWERLLENYSQQYWQENPEGAVRLVEIMLDEGRIRQPRLEGKEPPNIADGWWKV